MLGLGSDPNPKRKGGKANKRKPQKTKLEIQFELKL